MIHIKFADGYKVDIPSKIKCYDIVEMIFKNKNSIVFKVIQSISNKVFAAKIIPLNHLQSQKNRDIVDNEINILRSIRHQNIIKCYDVFNFKNEQNVEMKVIIEEFCSEGSLLDLVKKHGYKDENEKRRIMKSFIDAIAYLHSNNIAHCDIKMEHILLDENFEVKICDFGLSKNFNMKCNDNRNTTSLYASPELKNEGKIDFVKADIWSIGITLYVMETNTFPYKNRADVISKRLSIDIKNDCLKGIVMKCLQRKPNIRPNIQEIADDIYFSMILQEENEIILSNQQCNNNK